MRYEVVKKYTDTPHNPITIAKGEMVRITEETDPNGDWPNWVYCKGDAKEGWVPKQILDIKNDEATSLDDYSAREHDLMPEEILVSERELNGWMWGYKEHEPGTWGWAPINHLRKL